MSAPTAGWRTERERREEAVREAERRARLLGQQCDEAERRVEAAGATRAAAEGELDRGLSQGRSGTELADLRRAVEVAGLEVESAQRVAARAREVSAGGLRAVETAKASLWSLGEEAAAIRAELVQVLDLRRWQEREIGGLRERLEQLDRGHGNSTAKEKALRAELDRLGVEG